MSDEAIPAATLILVRDRPGGAPELLIVQRAEGMAFAGGALVFPGGRIDAADRNHADDVGAGEDGPARIAAIRETIEETAIAVGLEPQPPVEIARRVQQDLAGGSPFARLLEALGLRLRPETLVPLARWLPKFHAKRRFDTLFFLARAPAEAGEPHPLEGECAGAFWLSAAEVLERDRRGEAQLIFPTRRTLERLALHSSFEAMAADARSHRVEPITPWVEERGGERFIRIPDNLGFPVVEERLEGLWRG